MQRLRFGRRPGPPEIGSRVCRVSSHDDGMAERSGPLTEFNEAAIEWAAGGRGQGLVDAAAIALAEGLDSKTLRVLAGAPRRFADEEATELAAWVFEELGLKVAPRLSSEAVVDGARLAARRFLDSGAAQPRALAFEMWSTCRAAGYPDELQQWSGIDDDYDCIGNGYSRTDAAELDAIVVELARELAGERPTEPNSVG